jgi:uncharacterized protein (DUF1330 family)
MAKQYTFFSITHTTDAWVPAYAAAVPGLVVKHGGKILVQASEPERIEGNPAMRIQISSPSSSGRARRPSRHG